MFAAAESGPVPPDDSGTFILTFAGRQFGTEKFAIHSFPDRIDAEAEIQLRVEQDGKSLDYHLASKLVLDSQLRPLTYTWSQKGSQPSSLQVDFRTRPAKSRFRAEGGPEDDRDFDLPKDVAILDDNVFHHLELIAGRYNRAAGGAQTFQAFVPHEGLPLALTVTDVGAESVDIAGQTMSLRHLVVSDQRAHIDLWVDEQQRLQRVSIPEAQLEAVRKK